MHNYIKKFTFEDCRGVVRSYSGCSLFDREECLDLIEEVGLYLESIPDTDERSAIDCLLSDPRTRWAVDRILELNSIKPEWISWPILEALLFVQFDEDGSPGPPAIVVANQLRKREKSSTVKDSKPQSLPEIVASISHATGDCLEKAILLAKKYPVDFIMDMLEARADQLTPESEKAKRIDKEKEEKAKAEFKQQLLDPDSVFGRFFGGIINQDAMPTLND
jgi:hypothetical protein